MNMALSKKKLLSKNIYILKTTTTTATERKILI